MGLIHNPRAQLFDQTRLADPRLTHNERELTFTLASAFPTAEQQAHLVVAPDERSLGGVSSAVSLPPRGVWLNHSIELKRMRDALERLRAAILDHEQAGNELMDRGADDYRVALGGALNACGHVGCITEHVRAFVVRIADHYRSGVDSNPYRKRLKPLYIERSVERRHSLDDEQPCSHGTFGIVFVRCGIAEPSQHTIAEVLRNIALETRHRFGGNSLIAREDIAPFLGIELSRYLG